MFGLAAFHELLRVLFRDSVEFRYLLRESEQSPHVTRAREISRAFSRHYYNCFQLPISLHREEIRIARAYNLQSRILLRSFIYLELCVHTCITRYCIRKRDNRIIPRGHFVLFLSRIFPIFLSQFVLRIRLSLLLSFPKYHTSITP